MALTLPPRCPVNTVAVNVVSLCAACVVLSLGLNLHLFVQVSHLRRYVRVQHKFNVATMNAMRSQTRWLGTLSDVSKGLHQAIKAKECAGCAGAHAPVLEMPGNIPMTDKPRSVTRQQKNGP